MALSSGASGSMRQSTMASGRSYRTGGKGLKMNDLIRLSEAIKMVHREFDEQIEFDVEGHYYFDTENRWIADAVEDVLNEIPIIEAIPISWIYEYFAPYKKEAERLEKEYGGPLSAGALNDGKYNRITLWLTAIRLMISEWRTVAKEWDKVDDEERT